MQICYDHIHISLENAKRFNAKQILKNGNFYGELYQM